MLSINSSFFDKLLIKASFLLMLLSLSGAFVLFQQGGATQQTELVDFRTEGVWAFITYAYLLMAACFPLYLLLTRRLKNVLRFWASGSSAHIAIAVVGLTLLHLVNGETLETSSMRAVVILLCVTWLSAVAVRLIPVGELLRTLNRFYFFCFGFSFFLIFLVPSYGLYASNSNDGAWQGMFYHKNALGTFCATYTLISLATYSFSPKLTRLNFLMAVILTIGSQSYSAAGTILLVILLISLPKWVKNFLLSARGVVLMFALAISVLLVFLSLTGFNASFLDKDFSFTDRNLIWAVSLLQFSQSPWLGYGISALISQVGHGFTGIYNNTGQDLTSHHNGFIALLYDFGIVGAVIFVFIYCRAIVMLRGNSYIQLSCLIFFLGSILINTFEERLIGPNIFFLVFSLLMYLNTIDQSKYSLLAPAGVRPAKDSFPVTFT